MRSNEDLELHLPSLNFDVSGIVPKKAAPKEADNRKASRSKPEKIHLIDLGRADNIEIIRRRVKMPLPDMVAAILAMDDSLLDSDQVQNCLKFFPTKQQMEQLKKFTGDHDTLGKCEQVIFSGDDEGARPLHSTTKEILKLQTCGGFKTQRLHMLKHNELNLQTCGAPVGFRLESLLKLTDTRASNRKMTLMHHLCKVLAEKSPALLDFHEDLVTLEAASKIELKGLAKELQSLYSGRVKAEQELDASANDGPVSEGFHRILMEFVGQAEEEVKIVTKLYSVVGRNADALALYFGEDPGRCPFEQATLTLLNFVRLFREETRNL